MEYNAVSFAIIVLNFTERLFMDKIFVTRSSMPSLEEYTKEIAPIFENHWLTNAGVKHEELTEKLKEYMGVKGLSLVVNGHEALELALQDMNLPAGGEIITTPYTFHSTTHAIVRSGFKPVFCDIDPVTCTMDVDQIEKLITDKTVAIVPVHVYGNVCNDAAIRDIADRHGLKVMYDAAHTFGEKVGCDASGRPLVGQAGGEDVSWRGVATLGDVSCFSFHATKVFHTIEGGAVCSSDTAFTDRIAILRDFGIVDSEKVTDISPNAKMNEFAAAMGLCNLRHLEGEIEKRRRVAERYREGLSDVKGIRLNPVQEHVQSNYAYFPIFVEKDSYGEGRGDLFKRLAKHNIFARKYFYPMVTELDCYKADYDADATPVAKRLSYEVLTIPMFADLSAEDQDRIISVIRKEA